MRIGYKFTLILIVVVATAMMISAFFSSTAISNAFNSYFQHNASMRLEQIASSIGEHYKKNGWNGVENIFMSRGRGRGGFGMGQQFADRMIVVNQEGQVVADTFKQEVAQSYEAQSDAESIPILMNGEKVGTLIATTRKGQLEENFVDSIKAAHIKAGIFATIVVLVMGIYLSRRISKPLVELSEAARSIASRELSHRVPIRTNDEIGEVGKAFNQMAESLESNEVLRKNLIADVAHELRTPLSILRGNLELLEEDVIQPSPEVFASLHEESIRISRLVEDLQSLSHADAGELKFDRNIEDLSQVVKNAATELAREAAKKNIEIDVQATESISILMDRYRIGQVLYNLMSNAIRYTEQGQVQVTVTNMPNCAKVEVCDHGPGIEKEHLPFIFDRFYRVEKSRNRMRGGSGLGLAIAKSFVEAHDGEIFVESEIGQGSKFIFTLPKK
ncbi:MAG: sensor histidine kinase [Neobacillus sp.]|jgi:signal transduction histidine kinase|nr:sensor histidine kinase [Neobacillus sp.]